MNQKILKTIGLCLMICLLLFNGIHKASRKENIEKYLAEYYDNMDKKGPIQEAAFLPPNNWGEYRIAGAFSISIPRTLEMRSEADVYTKLVKDIDWCGYKVNINNVVFQQKGLSICEPEALETYCRVMLNVEKGSPGDYLCFNEWAELSAEDIQYFEESLQQASDIAKDNFKIIGKPNVCWVHIEDFYGIKVQYLRIGVEGNRTCVNTYYFFNNDRLATLTLSYRQSDADKWQDDLENIVRTFKWLN